MAITIRLGAVCNWSKYLKKRKTAGIKEVLQQPLPCHAPNITHDEFWLKLLAILLDGCFADLKRKLGCHHGMKRENKLRFIKDYFAMSDGG